MSRDERGRSSSDRAMHRSDGAPDVLEALRLTRRRNRMADLEWFEVAYRAYIVAFVVGYVVLWLSAIVRDDPVTVVQLATVRHRAPAIVGLLAAFVVLGGLRSGSRGGPVAIEDADVRHVLLAPVERRKAILRPSVQRLRTMGFGGLVAGLVLGQAIGRRLPGSMYRYAAAAGLVGASLGLAFGSLALIAHSLRVRESQATLIGFALIGVQGLAVGKVIPAGPLNAFGSIALWPLHVNPVDIVALVAMAALVGGALIWCGGLSLERLSRRSALVAQLRFAATLHDLRTVMLLRRQLSMEAVRPKPWFKVPRAGGPYWQRSWRSFARFPVRRLVRMLLLAAAAAGAILLAYRGTTPAVVVAGLATFLLGLEVIEPLAQQLDHPDLGDLQPVDVGLTHVRLLIGPTVVAAIIGAITGTATVTIAGGRGPMLAVGPLLGISAALGGVVGATLNTLAGAPDPAGEATTAMMMPPEMAGVKSVIQLAYPALFAVGGALPVLAIRTVVGDPSRQLAASLRSLMFVAVIVATAAYWVRVRPRFKIWWRQTMNGARDAKLGTPKAPR